MEKNLQKITQKCQICFKEIQYTNLKSHSKNCKTKKTLESHIDNINQKLKKIWKVNTKALSLLQLEKKKMKQLKKRSRSKQRKRLKKKKKTQRLKKSRFSNQRYQKIISSELEDSKDSNEPIAVIDMSQEDR